MRLESEMMLSGMNILFFKLFASFCNKELYYKYFHYFLIFAHVIHHIKQALFSLEFIFFMAFFIRTQKIIIFHKAVIAYSSSLQVSLIKHILINVQSFIEKEWIEKSH